MNSDKLSPMADTIIDECEKLGQQSALFHMSEAGKREVIREVLHIWEERKLRNRFYEIVTDEELSESFDDLQDCGLPLPEILEELNKKFEIRKDF